MSRAGQVTRFGAHDPKQTSAPLTGCKILVMLAEIDRNSKRSGKPLRDLVIFPALGFGSAGMSIATPPSFEPSRRCT